MALLSAGLPAVSRAGDRCLLAGPEGDVRRQVPATGGDDGQPEPVRGFESGAAGPRLHRGAQTALLGVLLQGMKNSDGGMSIYCDSCQAKKEN